MAQIPSEQEAKDIIDQNAAEHHEKAEAQAAEGKGFNVPADGHGPGVIPEETWKNLPGKVEAN